MLHLPHRISGRFSHFIKAGLFAATIVLVSAFVKAAPPPDFMDQLSDIDPPLQNGSLTLYIRAKNGANPPVGFRNPVTVTGIQAIQIPKNPTIAQLQDAAQKASADKAAAISSALASAISKTPNEFVGFSVTSKTVMRQVTVAGQTFMAQMTQLDYHWDAQGPGKVLPSIGGDAR